jgi:hypothetical protein
MPQLQQVVNDWSPWMKALSMTGDEGLSQDPNNPAGVGQSTPPPQQQPQEIPQQVSGARNGDEPIHRPPPTNRIADDNNAGTTRGGSPQGNSDRYAQIAQANQNHELDPTRYPLEQQIGANRAELARMNSPTRISLKDRIMGVIQGGAAGAGSPQQQQNYGALRDRISQQQFDRKQTLSNQIDNDTRALTTAGLDTQRMQTQEEMQRNSLMAAAQKEGQIISGANQRNENTVAGANQRNESTITGANERNQNTQTNENQRATQALGSKLDMFRQSQDYLRWKDNQDNKTKMDIAQLTAGKAPAALVQTAVFAKGGLSLLQDASDAMDRLQQKGVMGTLPANWIENYLFGNNAVDPRLDPETRRDIGKMRAAMSYTSSATMKAHMGGRSSKDIYHDFKQTLGPGQDWDALHGAMDETRGMLTQYAGAASNANMQSIRQGTNLQDTSQQPFSQRVGNQQRNNQSPPQAQPGMKVQRNKVTGEYRQVPVNQ